MKINSINVIGNSVGGLVATLRAGGEITSSYAIINEIKANATVGGLVGALWSGGVQSSYAAISNITGDNNIGGLVGAIVNGDNVSFSYATVGEFNINTRSNGVGGLIGNATIIPIPLPIPVPTNSVKLSYAVSNISIAGGGGLSGEGMTVLGNLPGEGVTAVDSSYWDNTTLTPSDNRNLPTPTHGRGLSTAALQTPTDFTGTDNIYADWANVWCDPDTGVLSYTQAGFSQVWDLGTANDYPTLNCFANFSPAQQRETARRALAGESLVQ